ncbi:hypothetical protein ACOMHN_002995 [Nucella lapillus]
MKLTTVKMVKLKTFEILVDNPGAVVKAGDMLRGQVILELSGDLDIIDYEDDVVEQFYEDLENTIKRIPKKDLLVRGDWNATVGEDAYEQWTGTVRRYGLAETNDRGYRLLEFASSHKLTLANTWFPHKIPRRTLWHSLEGKTHNQIDYILFTCRFKSSINKAKTRIYPRADIGSDHDMVLMTLRLKLKNHKPNIPRLRFDIEKLKDPDIAAAFKAKIEGGFTALNLLQDDINSLTDNIREVLNEIATEVLRKQTKKKSHGLLRTYWTCVITEGR